MFQWIRQRSGRRKIADRLYAAIVSQARQPEFYRTFGVADDVSGRFELICVHIFGIVERLGQPEDRNGEAETLGRAVIERFFQDMDDVMREMGVGDTTVPKKMRKTSEALYGRLDAYARGLRDADQGALAEALARNVYGDTGQAATKEPRALAGYVRAMIRHLDALDDADVFAGNGVSFPVVDAGSVAATAPQPVSGDAA